MTETYDIRQHLAVLTPSKGSKTKYHCPVCDKNDFDIDPKTGKYSCFSGGCTPNDIRVAIDKLEGKPEWKPEQKWKKSTRPKSRKDYFYPDRDGNNLVKVTRIDHGDNSKKGFPQYHWDSGKWAKGNPVEFKKRMPIYRYAEVQQAIERDELIFWVEGESTADLLWELGIAATTTIGGSSGYKTYGNYLEDLEGARLVLAPDRDTNGKKYIGLVDNDFPTQIEGYYLAGTQGLWKKPEGGMDIGDEIGDLKLTKEQILAKVISPGEYQEITTPKAKAEQPKTEETFKEERKSVGDRVLEIAREKVIYFHTADKVAYADISILGSRQTYAVRSKAFRLWLSGEYLNSTEKGIGSQTLQDTLNTLEAIAIFRGETREVHLRTAEHQGKLYLDLGTPDWAAVEIDSLGWRFVSEPPVRFWRPESLLPLPVPVEGGNLEELKDLLNVDGSSWTLIITFLLFCFCPDKTYPVMVLSAHRGSGKTAAAEIIKGLIDPGKAGLIKLQGDTQKLAVAATRRHLMVYDNVSHISPDQSDDLCRVATGFGYSTRTLHTTDEETTFEFTRPQIITAIDALVTRDDLADRVLMAQLPEIPAQKRLPQSELNAKVEAARPRILGALLTALSQTLAQPRPNPATLPRMADYALFAIASEKALGLKKGEFMKTFNESREQSRQIVIESSPVGEAIVRLMEKTPLVWKGTASELLNELEKHTDEATYRSRYFPKASNSLSRQLTRLAPDLKALGIQVGYFREGQDRNRLICLEKVVKISFISSIPSADGTKPSHSDGFEADDTMDDMRTILDVTDDIADGITNTDDTRTIPPSYIVRPESSPGQRVQPVADDKDDMDDKNSLSSNESPIPEKSLKVDDSVQLLAKTHERSGQTGIIKYFSGWFAAIAWADGSIDISHKTDNLELAEVAK
jgi:energy-coupling factor transporter ATP-binding protein EcfA2